MLGGYDGVSLAPRRQGIWHTCERLAKLRSASEKVYETVFIKIINIGSFILFVGGIIP